MPVWTPGSYLVREFSRNVLDFQALEERTNKPLEWRKDSKNSWVVSTEGAEVTIVRYRVYAFEFTVDTSYLDNLHGIVNGASVFMFVEGMESQPSFLEISPYPDWKKISTSLERRNKGDSESYAIFEVPSFDILVDSPIEIGNQEIHSFEVRGVVHEVSIFSPKDFDKSSLVQDIKKIVESTIPVIGEIPYKRYLFLVDVTTGDTGGGLEHLSSTHCIASYLRLEPIQEYRTPSILIQPRVFPCLEC